MKQKLFLVLCVLITNVLSAQIIPINYFEQGASAAMLNNAQYRAIQASGINYYSYVGCSIPTMFGTTMGPSTTVNNNNSLASVTSGITYLLGGTIPINTVGPGGQNLSMRLGNMNPRNAITNPSGFQGVRVSYTQQFTAQYKVVSFTYLAHFNSDHYTQLDLQPMFTARLLDMGNNIISTTPPLCLKADSSDPRLTTQGPYTYMSQWRTQKFLIPDNYIGQNLKIQFVTTDCGQLGHQGIAYIDNIRQENITQTDINLVGDLTFETGQINCPEDDIEVCLNFKAPDGFVLNNLTIDVINMGTNTLNHTINITNFSNNNNGTVCFEIDRDDLPTEGGNFRFSALATFKTTTGNNIHQIQISSPIQPHLIIGNSTPFIVTNPHTYPGDLGIYWTNLNTTYEVEYVSDEYCCPNHSGFNTVDSTIYSLTTTSTNINSIFFTMVATMNSKCLRFRIRPFDICNNYEWSDWCCVTSHTPEGGGYDINNPNDRHNICLEVIDLDDLTPYNPQPQPKPIVSPNPTTGNITVVNSSSTVFDIYDLSQNKVKTIKTAKIQEKVNIDLSDLKSGIYILKLNNNQDIKIIKD